MSKIFPLSCFLILFSLTGWSQKNVGGNTVFLYKSSETIKASLASAGMSKDEPKSDKIYSWYSDNSIFSTQGSFDGRLLNGPYAIFYSDGNLKEKGNFKNGLMNGIWKYWYDNGKLSEIQNWKNGLKCGSWSKFDIQSKLTLTTVYKNDLLHGSEKKYADGKLISERTFKKGVEIVKATPIVKEPASSKVKDTEKEKPKEDKRDVKPNSHNQKMPLSRDSLQTKPVRNK